MGRRVPAGGAEAFCLMMLRCSIVSDIPRQSHEVKPNDYPTLSFSCSIQRVGDRVHIEFATGRFGLGVGAGTGIVAIPANNGETLANY